MKQIALFIFTAIIFLNLQAQSLLTPQCFGASGVSESNPFILTIKSASESQVLNLVKDLNTSALLKVSSWYANIDILILAVNADQSDNAADINELARTEVQKLTKKNGISESNYALECNSSGGAL